ncbi:MAG: cytochrome c3 family protein, partial [Anaerolineales bacterium]|nr:cytochrome c3 family protein [Anaerolineales bacterium]
MSTKKVIFLAGGLLLLAALIVACGPKATPTPTEVPTAEPTPTEAPLEVPFVDIWAGSSHADVEAEAFIHWNEEDPAEIPTSCAKCHSAAGYQDFLGADGSEAGKVDAAVPAVGNPGILCVACHNPVTMTKTSVVFPSGVEVTGAGDAARCMECHQGRESKVSVDKQITDFNAAEALDAVPAPITDASGNQRTFGFRNIHYFPAAATLYGSTVHGGYEYDGKIYDIKNAHVEG